MNLNHHKKSLFCSNINFLNTKILFALCQGNRSINLYKFLLLMDLMVNFERCRDFIWRAQGYKFHTDMRLIPLNGCDAV